MSSALPKPTLVFQHDQNRLESRVAEEKVARCQSVSRFFCADVLWSATELRSREPPAGKTETSPFEKRA